MLKEFLANITLLDLPVIAMGIFLLIFLSVLVRVVWRGRDAYREVAMLPLEDGSRPADVTTDHGSSTAHGGAR